MIKARKTNQENSEAATVDAIDAQMEKLNESEEADDHEDLVESENDLKEQAEFDITATLLPIKDATAGKSCSTKATKQPRCPYSLKSCCQKEFDYIQKDARAR